MNDLPVMLRVAGRLCVVVGSGRVAARRVAALKECGARVRLIAPEIPEMVSRDGIEIVQRGYETGDLRGAFLVVVATDDAAVNEAVAAEAREQGALLNRADKPTKGDLTVPAHSHHGRITLAVNTGGVSAAAAAIRCELADALDPDWPRLLDLIAPYRAAVQQRFTGADERQSRLAQLADPEMMRLLKSRGDVAVKARVENLLT